MQVAVAIDGKAPAGMFGQSMQHVIEEANASADGNFLRLAGLGGMTVFVAEQTGVCVRREVAAVKVDGELDLGLVSVAGESSPAHRR